MTQIVLEEVKKQGLSLLLLCAAIYWMANKYDKMQDKVDKCNHAQIEILKEVIINNTKAINEFQKQHPQYNQGTHK